MMYKRTKNRLLPVEKCSRSAESNVVRTSRPLRKVSALSLLAGGTPALLFTAPSDCKVDTNGPEVRATLSLAILFFFFFCAPAWTATLEELDLKISALDSQTAILLKEYEKEKKANEERIRNAEDAQRKGKTNTAETWLREAYLSAEKLNANNQQLNILREQRTKTCTEWRSVYATTIDTILNQAQQEKDKKKKGEIGKKLQYYQERNVRLCGENLQAAVSQDWRELRIESYDGPSEIQQKLQLLSDISREIQINLSRLDRQYQDIQRERKTKERAREFIQESTLFTDTLNVRPATRDASGTGSIPTSSVDYGPGEASSGSGQSESPQVLQPPDWPGQSEEQIELQYQKLKSQLSAQQTGLQQKIKDFEVQAKRLQPQ